MILYFQTERVESIGSYQKMGVLNLLLDLITSKNAAKIALHSMHEEIENIDVENPRLEKLASALSFVSSLKLKRYIFYFSVNILSKSLQTELQRQ